MSCSKARLCWSEDVVSLQVVHELLVYQFLKYFGTAGQNGDGSVAAQIHLVTTLKEWGDRSRFPVLGKHTGLW